MSTKISVSALETALIQFVNDRLIPLVSKNPYHKGFAKAFLIMFKGRLGMMFNKHPALGFIFCPDNDGLVDVDMAEKGVLAFFDECKQYEVKMIGLVLERDDAQAFFDTVRRVAGNRKEESEE